MSSRRGKALAQKILFKVQVAGLELGSTPSQAQYKHFETKSPINLANPLSYVCVYEESKIIGNKLELVKYNMRHKVGSRISIASS